MYFKKKIKKNKNINCCLVFFCEPDKCIYEI